jgi:DUF1680 family protein
MYAVADNEIAVHLYGESSVKATLKGASVKLTQHTNYPWNGDIRFEVDVDGESEFGIGLRIPEWADAPALRINGEAIDLASTVVDGYARLSRAWKQGDVIELVLPLELRPQFASPKVRQDVGRVALARGPLIYCVEETDNGQDLNAIVVPANVKSYRTKAVESLNGAIAIEIEASREDASNWNGSLYRTRPPEQVTAKVTLVPYHLWDNRDPGSMLVWLQSEK